MLKAIAAVSPEGIIAIDGRMPWNVSEDLQRFKRITQDNVVIMGNNTFKSIGKTPLPNRINIVISRKGNLDTSPGVIYYNSIQGAIDNARLSYPDKTIWIMGGASLYSQTLPICDELELTIIKRKYVDYREGDRIYLQEFPERIDRLFKEVSSKETEHATYKKYIRRAYYKIPSPWPFFS